jgi:hypothetical protein
MGWNYISTPPRRRDVPWFHDGLLGQALSNGIGHKEQLDQKLFFVPGPDQIVLYISALRW